MVEGFHLMPFFAPKGVSTPCLVAEFKNCGFAVQQKVRIMWMSMQLGLDRASACCGIKIQSAKCQSHQRFATRHMMSKRFQNGISQLQKKIRWSSWSRFTVFVTWSIVCKKFFFNVDAIKLAAYAKQLLPRTLMFIPVENRFLPNVILTILRILRTWDVCFAGVFLFVFCFIVTCPFFCSGGRRTKAFDSRFENNGVFFGWWITLKFWFISYHFPFKSLIIMNLLLCLYQNKVNIRQKKNNNIESGTRKCETSFLMKVFAFFLSFSFQQMA